MSKHLEPVTRGAPPPADTTHHTRAFPIYLTVSQFAAETGMHPQTVRQMIARREIKARQRMPHSPYRIPADQLQKVGEFLVEY
ncbi:MAG: helix-turn-helix domain-containing protein [Corynebacterium glucuronolyticum]|nr:helix-turn-helix domain-containing protein [Mycobacteriaceae bacterium]MDY5834648.1 helix-turn-helix domain-containing protein [Corynebacterium glucuronolyticum]